MWAETRRLVMSGCRLHTLQTQTNTEAANHMMKMESEKTEGLQHLEQHCSHILLLFGSESHLWHWCTVSANYKSPQIWILCFLLLLSLLTSHCLIWFTFQYNNTAFNNQCDIILTNVHQVKPIIVLFCEHSVMLFFIALILIQSLIRLFKCVIFPEKYYRTINEPQPTLIQKVSIVTAIWYTAGCHYISLQIINT